MGQPVTAMERKARNRKWLSRLCFEIAPEGREQEPQQEFRVGVKLDFVRAIRPPESIVINETSEKDPEELTTVEQRTMQTRHSIRDPARRSRSMHPGSNSEGSRI